MQTNETLNHEERLKLFNAIRETMISNFKEHSKVISTENLKSIVQDFENNPEEFMWDDVRTLHKIFKQEIESRSLNF